MGGRVESRLGWIDDGTMAVRRGGVEVVYKNLCVGKYFICDIPTRYLRMDLSNHFRRETVVWHRSPRTRGRCM